MITDLSALLAQRSRSGDGLSRPLAPGEADRLAEQFIGMLRGFHQVRGLLGIDPAPEAGRKAYVAACVDLLLRAG
jgi:TetR/AcrR family transcriptional repressor of mexJK operon